MTEKEVHLKTTSDFNPNSKFPKDATNPLSTPQEHHTSFRLRPRSQFKIDDDHLNVIDIRHNVNQKKFPKHLHAKYCDKLHQVHATNLQLKSYLATQREQLREKYEFQPKINQKSRNLSHKLGRDIIERNSNWIGLRKERLEQKTMEIRTTEEQKLREVMNQPEFPTHQKNLYVVPKVKIYIEGEANSGYQQYLLKKQAEREKSRKGLAEMVKTQNGKNGYGEQRRSVDSKNSEPRPIVAKSIEKKPEFPRNSRTLSDFINMG